MARYTPVHSGYSITNGSATGPNSNRIDVWAEYAVVRQSVSENYSVVHFYFYAALKDGYTSETHSSRGLTVNLQASGYGQIYPDDGYDFRTTTPNLLASTEKTVYHDSDGTAYFSFSASFSTTSNYITGGSVSGGLYLPSIYREAYLTSVPSNTYDNSSATIHYYNPAGYSLDSIQACITDTGGSILVPYRNVSYTGGSYTFTFTQEELDSLYNYFSDTRSGSIRYYLKSVLDGETNYDYMNSTFTITDCEPIVEYTITEISDSKIQELTGGNKLIRYYSDVLLEMTSTPVKGASIEEENMICGKTVNTNYSVFNDIESGEFTFVATDSRNLSTVVTETREILDYTKLTCNLQQDSFTTSGNLSFTISGNYFNDNFGVKNNSLTVQYRYMDIETGEYLSWVTLQPTITGNTYTATATITGLDYTQDYNLQVRAIDELMTAIPPEQAMIALPIFDWSSYDFNFNVPVHINGSLTVTEDIEMLGISLKALLGLDLLELEEE